MKGQKFTHTAKMRDNMLVYSPISEQKMDFMNIELSEIRDKMIRTTRNNVMSSIWIFHENRENAIRYSLKWRFFLV